MEGLNAGVNTVYEASTQTRRFVLSPFLDDVLMSSRDSGITCFHAGLVLADELELESHEFCCQRLVLQLLSMTIKS